MKTNYVLPLTFFVAFSMIGSAEVAMAQCSGRGSSNASANRMPASRSTGINPQVTALMQQQLAMQQAQLYALQQELLRQNLQRQFQYQQEYLARQNELSKIKQEERLAKKAEQKVTKEALARAKKESTSQDSTTENSIRSIDSKWVATALR